MRLIDAARKECMEKYREECKVQKWPDFVPVMGRCYRCGYDFTKQGLVVPAYDTTGCPACHISYCE